jgi:hypothetical protein
MNRYLSAAGVAVIVGLALPAQPRAAGPALSVQSSIQPSTVRFGDPVTARVSVSVDRRLVNPETLQIKTNFAPYTVLKANEPTRSDRGAFTALSYRFELNCLELRCVSGKVEWHRRLADVEVSALSRDGRRLVGSQPWPLLTIHSRTNGANANSASLREQVDPPPVSYRVTPTTLFVASIAGAVTLLLAALAIVGHEVRRSRRRRLSEQRERALSLVEYAISLAREAVSRPVPDRRKALGLLARSLRGVGQSELALAAVSLAWSPSRPSPGSTEELVALVQKTLRTSS